MTPPRKISEVGFKPPVMTDLRRRLDLGLLYYTHHRPHQALGGATPAEIYFARIPAHLAAVPAPRGRPGQGRPNSAPSTPIAPLQEIQALSNELDNLTGKTADH